jgi:hypothetical protein
MRIYPSTTPFSETYKTFSTYSPTFPHPRLHPWVVQRMVSALQQDRLAQPTMASLRGR